MVATLTIKVVVTVLSQPLEAVNTSVYVPFVVYVFEPTVILDPSQILCVLDEVIAAFSVIVTVADAVHPQVSVTVTL